MQLIPLYTAIKIRLTYWNYEYLIKPVSHLLAPIGSQLERLLIFRVALLCLPAMAYSVRLSENSCKSWPLDRFWREGDANINRVFLSYMPNNFLVVAILKSQSQLNYLFYIVLLEYFTGGKWRSNYCILASIITSTSLGLRFYFVNWSSLHICLPLAKHSSNTILGLRGGYFFV